MIPVWRSLDEGKPEEATEWLIRGHDGIDTVMRGKLVVTTECDGDKHAIRTVSPEPVRQVEVDACREVFWLEMVPTLVTVERIDRSNAISHIATGNLARLRVAHVSDGKWVEVSSVVGTMDIVSLCQVLENLQLTFGIETKRQTCVNGFLVD